MRAPDLFIDIQLKI